MFVYVLVCVYFSERVRWTSTCRKRPAMWPGVWSYSRLWENYERLPSCTVLLGKSLFCRCSKCSHLFSNAGHFFCAGDVDKASMCHLFVHINPTSCHSPIPKIAVLGRWRSTDHGKPFGLSRGRLVCGHWKRLKLSWSWRFVWVVMQFSFIGSISLLLPKSPMFTASIPSNHHF